MTVYLSDYDTALNDLHRFGPHEKTSRFFGHGPMVAEALEALGRGDKVCAFVSAEVEDLQEAPSPLIPIRGPVWRDALGAKERLTDWVLFFSGRIDAVGWQTTARDWIDRLADGFHDGSIHAGIRVGHALRGLTRHDTPARRRELAHSLAVWAAHYQSARIPVTGFSAEMAPAEALLALDPLAPEHRPGPGPISASFDAVAFAPDFARQSSRVYLSGDPQADLDTLIIAFAGQFLHLADARFPAIVFCHAITGAAAVRSMLPWIDKTTAQKLTARAWLAGAALRVVFFEDHMTSIPVTVKTPEQLVRAAIDSADVHAVKLTEACLAAHARTGDPLLLQAATRYMVVADRRDG